MIRLLAAILATVGFLSMAPAVHATGSAIGGGAVAHGGTPPFMADGSQAPCGGGNPCLLVCAACFLAPPGQADNAVLGESKTKGSHDSFATFDLPWRLYRPPKPG